jgi:hypothetical protein
LQAEKELSEEKAMSIEKEKKLRAFFESKLE